jgi:trk system potassium uptake protein TrkH
VNLRAVAWLLGCVLLLMAGFMLVPAVVSSWYREQGTVEGCLLAALVTAALGGLLTFTCRGSTLTGEGRVDYFRREGLAAVGLAWLLAAAVGALPFLFSGALQSPVDAFFESASGFTTTGATILTGEAIEGLSRGMAFWRSFTHWLGGIGIVLVFVVLFPTGGRSLFRSEVPGISREAVQQRVRDSAIGLVRVYVGLTLAEVVLLWLLEHDLFEAFIHAFGTLATGGFSSHSSSVAHFGSWKVELVIVVFMFMAGINFAVYDTFLRKGARVAWRQAVGSSEIRLYAGLVVGSTLLIALVLWFWGGSNGDPTAGEPDYSSMLLSMRDSIFAVVSIVTSTGYATANFDQWPDVCRVLLLLLAVSGACAGSTGGGMKIIRVLILGKAAIQSVRRFARPRAIHHVRVDGRVVDDSMVGMISAYCGLWFFVFTLGTLALIGMNLQPPGAQGDQVVLIAATSVLATLNNIGPGLEAVGPAANFAFMPDAAKLLLSFFMILGRLEFYAVVVLFVPRFWRS